MKCASCGTQVTKHVVSTFSWKCPNKDCGANNLTLNGQVTPRLIVEAVPKEQMYHLILKPDGDLHKTEVICNNEHEYAFEDVVKALKEAQACSTRQYYVRPVPNESF